MDQTAQGISRREALKLTAAAAGAAAFATPIVVGAFSAPALAADPGCNPATNSHAVPVQTAAGTRWNLNCGGTGAPYGRYNAQRTTFNSSIGMVTVDFGMQGTDNFPVECSWYTITAPNNCVCSATWAVVKANDTVGCPSGFTQFTSVPGSCANQPTPPAGAKGLPYCKPTNGTQDCPSGMKLELVSLMCCCA